MQTRHSSRRDTAASVDAILNRSIPNTQLRQLIDGRMVVEFLGVDSQAYFPGGIRQKRLATDRRSPRAALPYMPPHHRAALSFDDPFGGVQPQPAKVLPHPSWRHQREPVDENSFEFHSGALPRIVKGSR